MLEMKGNQTNQKKVSNNSVEENVSPVIEKNQMNGIQNNEKSSENDVGDGTLDCASLPQSYYNEWKRLFLRSDYLRNLKNLSMQGSLRSSRFRSVCWKIFMGVLPEEISRWTDKTRESRSIYHDLKMQMIVNPRKAEPKDLSINNPLSQVIESPWNQFFIDNALRLTIKQDVIRTHPKIEFFHTDDIRTNMVDILFVYAKLRPSISYRQVVGLSPRFPEIDFFNSSSIHSLMVDTLFVYAKSFPHVAYMQGMHELLAPLIFVLHCDQQAFLHACETDTISFFPNMERNLTKEILNPEYLEHDAFSIFCKMMETIEPWYVSKEMPPVVMTNSMVTTPFARPQELIPSNVIVTKLTRVQDYLLKRFDPQLFEHLQKLDIAPQVYGIRWVRLLFGREFPFQDLLILWDAIFADGIGFDLVDYVFVAMLMYLRGSLLCSDYSSCLTPLMKFPPVPDIHYFINKALYLRDPKNRPPIADQFYCKPSQNQLASEGSRRNGESVTLSTRFSRLVRGKRPGSLFISSGLMSKSTSEPMNLITDSALSPVKENFQFTPSRKGSSASLPPPDLSTPLLSSNIHNNFSCQSLHRLDTSARSESTNQAPDNQGSPHGGGKFFVFGARGGRKNLTNKVKQMKSTSEQEILKALSSYSEMETICRRCAMELDGYIGTLQRHLFKRDAPNVSSDDEVFLALAGIKQIRDILKGAVKPIYLYDSPEHMQHSMNYDSSAFSSLRRKQQPVSAQSSLSGTPMCDRPLGKFFLATPDLNSCELESPELDARSEASVQSRSKMVTPVKTPSKPNLPSEVELGEVKNGSRDEKDDDPKTPINLNFKTSDSMMFGINENAGDLVESGPHAMLHFRGSPSRSPQQRQGRSKEGESTGVVRRREGSPMDRIADMFRSFGKF